MTDKEENFIKLLSLFDKEKELMWPNIEHDILPTLSPLDHSAVVNLFNDLAQLGSVDILNLRNLRGNVDGYRITEKGRLHLVKLRQQITNEEISKLRDEDEKRMMLLVNQSTLDTNKSVRSLNKHQSFNIWVMAAIAIFAAWTAYRQFNVDTNRDNQEQLFRSDIQKIKSQIQHLDSTLIHSHNIQIPDTGQKIIINTKSASDK